MILRLLGGASIETPAGPLAGRGVQRRRLALLALLAVNRRRGLSRERMTAFLWPEAPADRARHLLSDSIYRINQSLSANAVISVGDGLRLDPDLVDCDVERFAAAIDRADWAGAVGHYAGPLLDGVFLADAPEFEHWVDIERARIAADHRRALEAIAVAADGRGERAEAVRWWRELAGFDPLSGRVALALMRALAAAGEPAAAILFADGFEAQVRSELGAVPDRSVRDLAEQFRRAPTAWAPPPSPPSDPRMPSVAVLPFINLSTDAENEFFADGITEDLIAQLTKIRSLMVISRSSAMRFKRREENLRTIGNTLGVATVLDGSVRRSGDQVRIVAQLVDVATDRPLWAETYDRDLTDIFAIQTEVALQIAGALAAELLPQERARIRREPTTSMPAYQAYLQGRFCYSRYTEDSMFTAIDYFRRAIAIDPRFALAHAGIALAWAEIGMGIGGGGVVPEKAYREAREAVDRALALDGDLGDAHGALGLIKMAHDFDWTGAEAEFKAALSLAPGSADVHDHYGWLYAALERFDEALIMVKRAQELDPLIHRADFASTLIRAGRYQEGLAAARHAIELEPNYARARATLGWACFQAGHPDEGLVHLEHAVVVDPGSTQYLAQLGQALAMTGRVEPARAILARLTEMGRHRFVSPYHVAYVYTGLGEVDAAMDCLEQACRDRVGAIYGIKGSFLFAPLRSHARFRALLARMNLA